MKIIENTCAKICPVVAELRLNVANREEYIAFLEKNNKGLIVTINVLRDRVEGLEKRISKIRQQCFNDMSE